MSGFEEFFLEVFLEMKSGMISGNNDANENLRYCGVRGLVRWNQRSFISTVSEKRTKVSRAP
jgi:CRISPR/Cas system CMR-associated protein Cmr1 (group 7 of RAMP superfamily)